MEVSTSINFVHNWSVSKVLEVANWRSSSVFASFYFEDIQYIYDRCRSVGSFLAAGDIND